MFVSLFTVAYCFVYKTWKQGASLVILFLAHVVNESDTK